MAIVQNGDGKFRIADVADKLGVAPSTVSRALNGKKGVGARQREKIITLARELGYVPDSEPAVSVPENQTEEKKSDSRVIAFVLGDIRNPFYVDLAYTIQKLLAPEGYQIVIINTDYSVEKEREILFKAKEEILAGMFLVTVQSREIVSELNSEGFPVVLVNRNLPSFAGDSVFTDNFQAGYMAAVHLIDLYHRNIGFVRGPEVSAASSMRYEGFIKALSNFGLSLDKRFVFETNLKLESGRKAAAEFLKYPAEERPGAMIIGNDLTALGFMDECRKQGLSIPEDLSVISFDDIIFSSISGIDLTTVSQQAEDMGKEAARLMMKHLRGTPGPSERIIINPELIIRKSTARAEVHTQNRNQNGE